MYPPYPSLEAAGLRLATAADIGRLADFSVLGFKDSEIFRFERPRYQQFPEDAIASFANIFRSQLLDPSSVVIVVEDWQENEEASHFPLAFHQDEPPRRRVVVGVASWNLPLGSPRTGQFVVSDVGDPAPTQNRDLCQRRLDIFTKVQKETEAKYLTGAIICDKLVVHPSYQRRGHATSMLQWSLQLCDQDGVNQGVIPSHMGEPVYVGLGYKVIGEMQVPDDGEVKGFAQRVVLYSVK